MMKSILVFLFVSVLSLNAIAQGSNLSVFSEDGLPFYLILNGIRQNKNPETNVRVNDLINEYYTAKIIFSDQSLPTIEKKMVMVVDVDKNRGEVTYKIKKNKRGVLLMKYFSFTPAVNVVAPSPNVSVVSYNTVAMPSIVFNAQVTETVTTTSSVYGSSDNVSVDLNIGGLVIDANINVDDHFGHDHTQTITTIIATENVQIEETGCYPMAQDLFNEALKSIESQSFSDTKLSQAKQITQSNCLTAKQIKSICKVFSFEDTKITYAKYAYDYCYDKNNYWQLGDVFSFESSTEELNKYIKNR